MFVLDAMDLSLRSGVSPDRIPEAIANRFSFHLDGREQMDNRVSVRISPRQIRFFYYYHDYDKDENGKNKYDPNGITDNAYVKEVGFISLTRRKDTGNDILAFPQNINDLDILKTEKEGEKTVKDEDRKKIADEIKECNENWKAKFSGFPFADKPGYDEEKPEENLREAFRSFMRYCLLCFVYEFEDRGMAFGGSPIYDKVRDKLREADVYNMLSAKLQYTMYLYNDKHYSQNQEKYTYYTQKFADCLMDKNLNKVISPDNYCVSGANKDRRRANEIWTSIIKTLSKNTLDIQGWFYNPEEELERLLEKNRQQECESAAALKDPLVSKIRSFLYTKHAIDRAMTSSCGKLAFWFAQLLMLGWSCVMIACSLGFQNHKWNWMFDDNLLLMIVWGVFIVFFIFCSGYINGRGILNAFFPRIIVAEAAAWLTIGIAEDLVKSMLWTGGRVLAFAVAAVLILVIALIFGETKQHSPYFRRGENITKTLLVMNHSLFFALALGCVMQLTFYNNLLKTSNVLSEVVYKEHFDEVKDYLQRLEDVEKSISEYRVFARDYEFGNMQLIGKNQGKTGIKGSLKLFGGGSVDSVALSMENSLNFGTNLKPSSGDHVCDYHNALVNNIKTVLKETDVSVFMMSECRIDTMDSRNDVEIINSNVVSLNRITPKLKLEIRETKKHLMENDYETLINWSAENLKQNDNENETQSEHLNELICTAKERKCSMSVSIFGNDRCFYPTLLLLHTLIVLVLAFITQLIISDKSVTEPL